MQVREQTSWWSDRADSVDSRAFFLGQSVSNAPYMRTAPSLLSGPPKYRHTAMRRTANECSAKQRNHRSRRRDRSRSSTSDKSRVMSEFRGALKKWRDHFGSAHLSLDGPFEDVVTEPPSEPANSIANLSRRIVSSSRPRADKTDCRSPSPLRIDCANRVSPPCVAWGTILCSRNIVGATAPTQFERIG
jgi:hypothetical protein